MPIKVMRREHQCCKSIGKYRNRVDFADKWFSNMTEGWAHYIRWIYFNFYHQENVQWQLDGHQKISPSPSLLLPPSLAPSPLLHGYLYLHMHI